MRRTSRLAVVVLLLVSAVLAPATAASAPGSFGGIAQQNIDPDIVVLTAEVQADGDARWTVAYRMRLDDDNETQAFESLQADIAAEESAYTDRFRDRMARTARAAENATGREMAVENVTVQTRRESLGQTYGVVSYRFEWTNFALVGDGRMVIGESLGGMFLDSETTLTIGWPAGYQASTIIPEPDDRSNTSATWQGRQQFGADEPRVVVVDRSTDAGFDPIIGGALVVILVLLVAATVLSRRFGVFDTDDIRDASAAANPGGPGTDSTYTVGSGGPPADEDAETGTGAADTADAADDDPEDTRPPAELLSNEEQVMQLLDRHGGRIKQQRVASELDWTDAKTSQVISGLRDEDELETFRIGRENVVTLPDTDLTEIEDADGEDEE